MIRPRSPVLVGVGWLAVSMAAFPAPAASGGHQAVNAAARYSACMAKAESTRDMQECQKAGLADAEARLRVVFAKTLASLPADQQAKLKRAQERWIVFRTADCQVFYGLQTGTIATVQGGQCMIDRTESRLKELAGFQPAR